MTTKKEVLAEKLTAREEAILEGYIRHINGNNEGE